MKLQNKAVVVTGASSGMGKTIVELFAKEGANVVAVARRKERLEELAASLKGVSGKVVTFVGDVSKKEDNVAMIDAAVKEFGRMDVLVNNAGIMDDMGAVGDMDDDLLENVLKVNTFGPLYSMRKAVQVFLAQGNGGNIINVASVGAMHSVAGVVYCASKAAVVQATKHTAFMYLGNKIRCNVICPGGITTEIHTVMPKLNETGLAQAGKVHALSPPPGTTDDIAHAALYLACDESKYVSGVALAVDGGWTSF